jgi:IS5 family transposase
MNGGFGMKCHLGVDAGSRLIHTMKMNFANENGCLNTENPLSAARWNTLFS